MATAPSTEASEIRRRGRRRLLGAVTLVMALVVFVPMILDNEPRPSRAEPSLVIPPKDKVAALPAPVVASSSRPSQSDNGPGSNLASPKAPPSASGEVVVPPAPSPSPPAPQSGNGPGSNSASPKLEGFAVQVGAFKDEERLKQARAKLELARIPHYIERVDTSGGAMTRLRAGPFPTREAADAARAKLNDGQVVALP